MNKRFFFVRSDNDLDHIAPVIDVLKEEINTELVIYARDPLRLMENDFRINHLLKSPNVRLVNFRSFMARARKRRLTRIHKIHWNLVERSARSKARFVQRILGLLIIKYRECLYKFRDRTEGKLDLPELLYASEGQVLSLASDYGVDTFTKRVLAYCRNQQILSYALPHSINHLSGNFAGAGFSINQEHSRSFKFIDSFDKVIVVNSTIKSRMLLEGIPVEKMIVTGNLRFSEPWISKLREIYPHKPKQRTKDERLTVLIVMSKLMPHVNMNEIYIIMRAIVNDPRYKLLIKPHTRVGFNQIPYDIARKAEIVADDVPTFVDTDNADLILFWGTSFIYDPIVIGKQVLQLKYPFALDCDFSNYIKEWEITSRDKLSAMLSAFAEDPSYQTIKSENRKSCILHLVGGGIKDNYEAVKQAFNSN